MQTHAARLGLRPRRAGRGTRRDRTRGLADLRLLRAASPARVAASARHRSGPPRGSSAFESHWGISECCRQTSASFTASCSTPNTRGRCVRVWCCCSGSCPCSATTSPTHSATRASTRAPRTASAPAAAEHPAGSPTRSADARHAADASPAEDSASAHGAIGAGHAVRFVASAARRLPDPQATAVTFRWSSARWNAHSPTRCGAGSSGSDAGPPECAAVAWAYPTSNT